MSRVDSLFDLSGKTALVVGTGRVAQAIAALYQDANCQVTYVPSPDLSEAGVAALFAPFGELDILVNGATRNGPWSLDSLQLDEWDRVHAINVRGAFLLMRAAVRSMIIRKKGGRLINISTIGSLTPVLNGNFAYGSSRAGTNALTRQFALDFAAHGILSNAILVGAVPSDPFPEGISPVSGPGSDPNRLLGGLGRPQDIAPTALLLASEAGRYINGQTITIDGGFSVG